MCRWEDWLTEIRCQSHAASKQLSEDCHNQSGTPPCPRPRLCTCNEMLTAVGVFTGRVLFSICIIRIKKEKKRNETRKTCNTCTWPQRDTPTNGQWTMGNGQWHCWCSRYNFITTPSTWIHHAPSPTPRPFSHIPLACTPMQGERNHPSGTPPPPAPTLCSALAGNTSMADWGQTVGFKWVAFLLAAAPSSPRTQPPLVKYSVSLCVCVSVCVRVWT